MIVSIMQPAYIPWLGYFDRVAKSDLHIVLDDVVMDRNSKTKFTNRNKIRTPSGWSWLTVPLQSAHGESDRPINKIIISSDSKWRDKHFNSIISNYSRAKFFSQYYDFFNYLYNQKWVLLNSMLDESTKYISQELDIRTERIASSNFSFKSKKSKLILDLCIEVGATTYLSGSFGRDYLNQRDFEEAGIELEFHDYSHPVYEQNFDGFEPYMSVIDVLCNHGKKSLDILRT